jgi:hypothetical protein
MKILEVCQLGLRDLFVSWDCMTCFQMSFTWFLFTPSQQTFMADSKLKPFSSSNKTLMKPKDM